MPNEAIERINAEWKAEIGRHREAMDALTQRRRSEQERCSHLNATPPFVDFRGDGVTRRCYDCGAEACGETWLFVGDAR